MTAPAAARVWKVVAADAVGTSHTAREVPCQDAHAVAVHDDLLVIAVADGAGSAPRSAEGARAAVEAAVAYVLLCAGLLPDDELEAGEGGAGTAGAADDGDDDGGADITLVEMVQEAVLFARDAVVDLADGDDPRSMATTLAVVVVDGEHVAAAQVGDGAVVMRRGEDLELLGAVAREEFLNETCFLTSAGWEDELRVDVTEVGSTDERGPIDAIAALTDGLQLLALDLVAGRPHAGFFTPLFHWASGPTADPDELAAFLASERVCARTDDDKTLVLATVAPPAPPPSSAFADHPED